MARKTQPSKSAIVPCWGKKTWPPEVWPHNLNRADYLIRTRRAELLAAGAICRVGREIVVIGPRYTRWLERQASRVPDFEIAPNKPTEAA